MYFSYMRYDRIAESISGDLIVDNIQLAGTVASLLNAIQIAIMNAVYSQVSVSLNNW